MSAYLFRDEVLSADFNMTGEKIVSCGMDHSLKIWNFAAPNIQAAVAESYKYDLTRSKQRCFPTALCHFPEFRHLKFLNNYSEILSFSL
jgi:polycomb protein EED